MSLSALILAGGSGTRFWPASRRLRPKQLLTLEGERSLLQTTVDRLAPLVPPERVWISTTAALAGAVGAQLPEVPARQILVEPAGRNTAPAIAGSLLAMPPQTRGEAVAVLPADHRIGDAAAFRRALAAAARLAEEQDRVLTLGVVPTRPETGFGYLEVGGPLADTPGARAVRRFTEKPDRATAERFVAGGGHLWNAGIFVFRGTTLLARLERHAPEIASGLAAIERAPERAAELYAALPSISIDFAVMEKLDDLVTLPLDCGWNDLGSWDALHELLAHDAEGNASRGAAWVVEGAGNLVFAEEGAVGLVGVSDLVVVASGGAVLVAPRSAAQEVRRIVERLAAAGRSDLL